MVASDQSIVWRGLASDSPGGSPQTLEGEIYEVTTRPSQEDGAEKHE
jgi:hypothetical protein